MSLAAPSLRPSHVAGHTLAQLARLAGGELVRGRRLPARRDLLPTALVTGMALDSRLVRASDIFVAAPGGARHGAEFAEIAAEAGAIAFLTDPAGRTRCVDTGLPTIVVEDVRGHCGPLAAAIYAYPAQSLTTCAVTGTNGKTTTSYLLTEVLHQLGRAAGLIGTVQIKVGDLAVPAALTTPEAPDLQAILATMVEQCLDAVVMEVSSHALARGRVDALTFDVAGFTNLSRDHLDFHHDMDSYLATKAQLFTAQRARRAVICIDDEAGQALADSVQIPTQTLSVHGHDAHWRVTDIVADPTGSAFTLHGPAGCTRAHVGLPGDFNVANAALALAMAAAGPLPEQMTLDAVVPGRMEKVSTTSRVYVDFAHNGEALAAALAALRPTTSGKLTVVFGATGDRDTSKRPVMARAAAQGADFIVLTDDDPHREDPGAIRAELAAELTRIHAPFIEVAPRADAITAAIDRAGDADTVLIAGRGHERIQEVGDVDVLLDDRDEARRAVKART